MVQNKELANLLKIIDRRRRRNAWKAMSFTDKVKYSSVLILGWLLGLAMVLAILIAVNFIPTAIFYVILVKLLGVITIGFWKMYLWILAIISAITFIKALFK